MKILFVKRGALGDVLMTTPLVRQIRQRFPQAQLDYVIGSSCKSALTGNPRLNNIISLPDRAFSAAGVGLLLRFIWSIRGKYDHVFILGKNWNINLLFKFAASKLTGFAREKISQWLLNSFVIYNDTNRYQVDYYLDLLTVSKLAQVNYADIQMELATTSGDKEVINTFLAKHQLSNFIVVTNSGGNNGFENSGIRMLPEDKILELLTKLLSIAPVVLLGGSVDAVNYTNYRDKLDNPQNLFLCAGVLTLPQSVELLKLADHFYVTDCGSMHLGLAAQINDKMTCFFGPTNPRHILPANFAGKIVWQDQDVFDPEYQINGKINNSQLEYFKSLDFCHL